jgi:hypothetical protein
MPAADIRFTNVGLLGRLRIPWHQSGSGDPRDGDGEDELNVSPVCALFV